MHPGLKERMLYTWSAIYHSQLGKGDDYTLLRPAISVWIVTGVLFPETGLCHLPFHVANPETGLLLNDHFALHVLQLPKWRMRRVRITEKDRWMYFFKEGKNTDVDDPPDILKDSKEMRDAMEVLNEFSENRGNYLLYQSRLEAEMVRQTILTELEKAIVEREKERAEKEKERAEKEKERAEKERVLKEMEKLKRILKEKGLG